MESAPSLFPGLAVEEEAKGAKLQNFEDQMHFRFMQKVANKRASQRR